MKFIYYICVKNVGAAVIFGKETIFFIESFIAVLTDVSAFLQNKEYLFAAVSRMFNCLFTIIVNAIYVALTTRTNLSGFVRV